jgi:hypothetical protein
LLPSVIERYTSEFTKEAREVEEIAISLVVDEAGVVTATEILGKIATTKKKAEEVRKALVQPLQQQVNEINSKFKETLAPLVKADTILRNKVQDWHAYQERLRREEEERLRKLMEKEQKKAEKKAEKRGEAPPPPMPVPVVPQAPKTVKTDTGSTSIKTFWAWEVEDETKVPREYLMLNDQAISAAVKMGIREIPGIRIFQKQTLAVRGKIA